SAGWQVTSPSPAAHSSKPAYAEQGRLCQGVQIDRVAGQDPGRARRDRPSLRAVEGGLGLIRIGQDQKENAAPLLLEDADLLGSRAVCRVGEQDPTVLDTLEHDKMAIAADIQ